MLLEFLQKPDTATSICAGSYLTIARAWSRQEITWQLVKASTAVRIGSTGSVRTGVRDEPLSLPNHMGQPIFAAAATRARTAGRRDAATSRRTAGASHAPETRAGPDSTEGAGFAGKLAFP